MRRFIFSAFLFSAELPHRRRHLLYFTHSLLSSKVNFQIRFSSLRVRRTKQHRASNGSQQFSSRTQINLSCEAMLSGRSRFNHSQHRDWCHFSLLSRLLRFVSEQQKKSCYIRIFTAFNFESKQAKQKKGKSEDALQSLLLLFVLVVSAVCFRHEKAHEVFIFQLQLHAQRALKMKKIHK